MARYLSFHEIVAGHFSPFPSYFAFELLPVNLINTPPGYTSFRSSIWISRSRRPASKWEKSISGLRD